MQRAAIGLIALLVLVGCDGPGTGVADIGADQAPVDGPPPLDAGSDGPGVDAGDAGDLGALPLVGVYTLTGTDPTHGSYSGTAEIRVDGKGKLAIHHVQIHDSTTFEGDRVALAWQGLVTSQAEPYRFGVTLQRVGWITSYKSWSRTGADPTPVTFEAEFTHSSPTTIAGTFSPKTGSSSSFSESWTWTGPGGKEPIWRDQRQLIAGHAAVPTGQKNLLFATFATFHDLPTVKPYISDPRFQQMMHYWVFDPTDHDFYQQASNSDVLRVIQKVVDPISLVEARVRNRAFRQTLAQKAAHYDQEVAAEHLNSAGMYGYFDPVAKQHLPDGDGLEWTGDYLASQAMRYLATKQQVALDNMLKALKGIILCYDIAPKKGDFARTIREHVSDGNPIWIQGLPPYDKYDWMVGANNDMLKGFQYGFFWAHVVLDGMSGHDDLKQRMVQISTDLLSDNPDAGDKMANEAYFRLLLYIMTGDLVEYATYQGIFLYLKPWLIDWGNGSTYLYGISDWSGIYMNIKSLSYFYLMEQYLQIKGRPVLHIAEYRQALTNALQRMRSTRLGFYQLAAATLGDFPTPPPELQDALWVMRSFATPKVQHNFDWRINPDFCISPVPNLPWKLDWAQPGSDRTHSLTIYPLFERNPSNIEWKEVPGSYFGSETTARRSGADYLLAYWFGRYFGSITPSM